MSLTSWMRVWLTRSFQPFTFTKEKKTLLFQELDQLGLYVHIPFCKTICSFCPYCKQPYDQETAEAYVKALLQEIDLVGATINEKKQVTSLYFGGGTPALAIDSLGEIIQKLQQYFIIQQDIGVELHPQDVTVDTLLKLKQAGVTMISIGIQSFDSTCLQALGRKETDYQSIFQALKEVPFQTVDMDLIFAIPGQTEQSIVTDIETAFTNGATQISTYPFIDFTFANNQYKPLSEKQKKKMLHSITKYCDSHHIKRTSVWTFAKENTAKYSSITRDNFLGFGVSATTLLKDQFKINTFSIEGYIERIYNRELPTSVTLQFSLRQRAVYYLFWAAYSMQINTTTFQHYFGIPLRKLFGFELFVARLLGFIKQDKDTITLTNKGAYYYHYIEQAYTTAYIDKMWNISRNIAFPDEIILK